MPGSAGRCLIAKTWRPFNKRQGSLYVSDRQCRRLNASLVQELEREAYDSSASLSNMLRKAKAIAVKLQLKQPIRWVEAELNGYTTNEVPEYRKIQGRLKAHNPYRGLIPMSFNNSEIEAIASSYWSREPSGTLEHILATTNEPMLPMTGERAAFLARMSSAPDFQMYLLFSPSSFQGILDAVRNRVLDWSLQLQADGIMGEGISFREEERAKVSGKGDTYHIGSIGNFAGNIGGQVNGDVSATSTQNMGQELEKVTALVVQLRAYQGYMGLTARQDAEVGRHIDALDEELRGKKPKPGAIAGILKSIKTVAEGTAGNLVASGVVSAISNINL